eukprot:351777-Chlamydomonas_euryale.AAC.1
MSTCAVRLPSPPPLLQNKLPAHCLFQTQSILILCRQITITAKSTICSALTWTNSSTQQLPGAQQKGRGRG